MKTRGKPDGAAVPPAGDAAASRGDPPGSDDDRRRQVYREWEDLVSRLVALEAEGRDDPDLRARVAAFQPEVLAIARAEQEAERPDGGK